MTSSPTPEQPPLTLTELLAAQRTSLANERTLLAYSRTALGLIVTGTGFGNYLAVWYLKMLFFSFIPLGILVLLVGVVRYWQRRRRLRRYTD
jgi:putative membrane protein